MLFSVDVHIWKYLVNPFVQPNDTTKPIVWNNFSTVGERNAYLDDRLYNYDKTDTMTAIPGSFVCTDFARQLVINFNGYGELGFDPAQGLQNNGWHNIPMYTVTLMKPNTFHQIAGVFVGNNLNFNSLRLIGPSNDSTYTYEDLKQLEVYKIVINYTRVTDDKTGLEEVPMFEFIPDGNGGWEDSGYRNPDIKLIEERGK